MKTVEIAGYQVRADKIIATQTFHEVIVHVEGLEWAIIFEDVNASSEDRDASPEWAKKEEARIWREVERALT